jgi:hypothetical protein
VLLLLIAGVGTQLSTHAQGGLGPFDRDSAQTMLRAAKDDLKKNYFDATLHGLDIDTRFKEAEDRISKQPRAINY